MKKVVLRLPMLICIALLSTSCAIQSSQIAPNVIVQSPNSRIAGLGKGASSAVYVFGIGGFDKDGLMYLAKKDLYNNCNLRPNQFIANITIDNKYSLFFPIFYKHSVILSADIVEYPDTSLIRNVVAISNNLSNLQSDIIENIINVGDKVKFKDNHNLQQKGVVSKIEGNVATIDYTDWYDEQPKKSMQKIYDLKKD